jgi:G3E family GTPase
MNAHAEHAVQPGPRFIVVSGMLGSGKTSLIESLLKRDDASDTAIIVNEAGEINIDGAVLSESARGMSMATLSNGCVCCSLTSDLVLTVQDLAATRRESGLPPLACIVLECSGLSRPGPIIASLQELADLRLRLHLVTTYDCSRPPLDAADFDDAIAQLGAANTIVLTKVDLVANACRDEALKTIESANPLARVVNESSADARAREAFRAPERAVADALPAMQAERRALLHPRVRVFRAKLDDALPWHDTLDWLENITGVLGERLLRMKAIVPGHREGERVLLQSVGTTFSAPRRMNDVDAPLGAIVIARDCGLADLEDAGTPSCARWTHQLQ